VEWVQGETSGSGRRRRAIGALALLAFMVHEGRRSGRQYRTPVLPAPLRPALRAVPGIHFGRLSVVRE
jgi:hypothetical protein